MNFMRAHRIKVLDNKSTDMNKEMGRKVLFQGTEKERNNQDVKKKSGGCLEQYRTVCSVHESS